MRRKIGPGVWEDMGPGSAVGGRPRGAYGEAIEGARNVGQMVPEQRSPTPMPAVKGQTTTDGSRMGITPRRGMPIHVHRQPQPK